ncbi:hypothetical protein [Haliangium sp. UPWRP_2]|uniref:hypothetical protein n=1 Tax=Haliangium sp. UPWRP_2 TaxID=1931276 RepID=UPI000B547C94|nr:hypothetical protein [Haliangium sp. UPWRP_2]PSM31244.1 hypothetical protein BVG81_006390 [Haliangium sp. UPWRP_2]
MSRALLPSELDRSAAEPQSGSQPHAGSQAAEVLQAQAAAMQTLSLPHSKPGSHPPPAVQAQLALPIAHELVLELVQAGTNPSEPHKRPSTEAMTSAEICRSSATAETFISWCAMGA